MSGSRAIALSAALLLVVVVALVVGATQRWPGEPWRVRITHTSGPATGPVTVAVEYCRPSGSLRALPICETVPTRFDVEEGAHVADVPRSLRFAYREHALTTIPIDRVRVLLDGGPDGDRASDDGIATVRLTLGDMDDWARISVEGMRELHIDVDDQPLMTTTLTPRDLPLVEPTPPETDPDTGEPLPPRTEAEIDADLDARLRVTQVRTAEGELPRVRLCRGGHATFEFDVRPWPRDQSHIEAVLVDGDPGRLFEEHYRERFRPERELPLIVTRDEWQRLLARDATHRGYAGGTPTLTIARGNHTATLFTAVGEGFETPEFDDGVVLVGVFRDGATSAAVGAVRVEVTRYRCRETIEHATP